MSQNPLQKYFRQPKIYIKLPSNGVFYEDNVVIQGDITRIPVFGMTGMDEIIAKTPDALLTGESTVKIIQSCLPNIVDAWKINLLDLEIILSAIRIATYGQNVDIVNTCNNCGAENKYAINLSTRIDFFNNCVFDNKIKIDSNLVVYIKPLTYKESSEYAVQNFQMQQKLKQIIEVTDNQKRQDLISETYEQVGQLQKEILLNSIEYIETADIKVTESRYIKEWLENCDMSVYTIIQEKIESNNNAWKFPNSQVKCGECQSEQELYLELDKSNFFGKA